MSNDQKPSWEIFKVWGGDNRQYRLITHIITCAALVAIAYIIWG